MQRELASAASPNFGLGPAASISSCSTPEPHEALRRAPRPIFLYVGRVAVEKNIEAFLELDLPGTKLVVGDGPQRAAAQARYPAVQFAGCSQARTRRAAMPRADVFVFPSRTDTFGLVLLEAHGLRHAGRRLSR